MIAIPFGGNNTSGSIEVATAVNAHGGPAGRLDFETETFIAFDARQSDAVIYGDRAGPLDTDGHSQAIAFDTYNQTVSGDTAQTLCSRGDTPGGNAHLVPAIAFSCKDDGGDATENVSPTLRAGGFTGSHANAGVMPAIAFSQNQVGEVLTGDVMHSLQTNSNATGRSAPNVMTNWAVRRLTPVECERLQGFPDDYTQIPWRGKNGAPDGPRYKVLGNSMAVNAMRWLGRRIETVAALTHADSKGTE